MHRKIRIKHKSPDMWRTVIDAAVPGPPLHELGDDHPITLAREELSRRHLEFGEYGVFELELNERLEVVGGRVLRREEW